MLLDDTGIWLADFDGGVGEAVLMFVFQRKKT